MMGRSTAARWLVALEDQYAGFECAMPVRHGARVT
jgi:hypothetical protein